MFLLTAGHKCRPPAAKCRLALISSHRIAEPPVELHGHNLVSGDRDRHRGAHDFTDLCARGANDGLGASPPVDPRDFTGITAAFDQRNETGLGVCLALTDGGKFTSRS